MRHRLMNEASEIDSSSSAGEVVSELSTHNEFGEVKAESLLKDLGLDPTKYNLDDPEEPEVKEPEQGSSESEEKPAQETEESGILKAINSLGAEKDGKPVVVNSMEEVKNALQMFKDYTQKTQALSEERKSFDSEKVEATKVFETSVQELNASIEKHQQQLAELEQWTFALGRLKDNAPDIFDEVQRAYEGVKTESSNPFVERQIKALREEMEPIKKMNQQRENELILKGFDSEYNELKDFEQSLKELGINVDRNAVRTKWANTGLTAKEAMNALYGEQLWKASASKAKVDTVQKKVASKPTGAATASRPGSRVPDVRGTSSYLDAAMKLYNSYK